MVKTLKVFIFLLFILSICALVFGSMLFGQREKLKTRILEHEKAKVAISEKLRMEKTINPATMKNHETLTKVLLPIAAEADNLYNDLQDTLADLEMTKMELADTKETLESTKTQLAAKQEEVNTLEEEKIALNERIDEKQTEIDGLEQEKQGLAAQVTDFKNQLSDKESEIDLLNDKVTQLEQEVERLQPEDINTVPEIPVGEGGTITKVENEWNFVVLDIGREIGLKMNTELMVHRNDVLIGKIKISSLEDHMAVADVVEDHGAEPIRVGDEVIYVNL